MKTLTQKLTSRKFLAAIMGVISGTALVINGNTVEGVTAIITSVIAYIAAEGYIDAKAVGQIAQGVADSVKNAESDTDD